MAAFPPAHIAESDESLFSPVEMRFLMEAELYRARRYGFSLTLMLISVDRLGSLHDLYGFESKREILRGVIDLFRSILRSSDYLGCLSDDRIVALFPHTDRQGAGAVAQRLLRAARDMQFESDGRLIRISLSIGVAENDNDSILTLDDFQLAAEAGLSLASEEGGDRYVVREEVESELDQLKQELAELKAGGPGAVEPVERPSVDGDAVLMPQPASPEGEALAERIRAVFASLAGERTGELAHLEAKVIALALQELGEGRGGPDGPSSAEYESRIQRLERRIGKLNQVLGKTEEELRRVLQMKNVDPGLASIYRAVQGLSDDGSQNELKRVLMREIFEANLELKKQVRPDE